MVDTNGEDDVNCGDGDRKFGCGDDIDGADGDDEDDGDVNDDDDVEFNIGNDANCGDGNSKVSCSEDTAGDDSSSNFNGCFNDDGGGDTSDNGRDGDSDREINDGADGHKNVDDDDGGGYLVY